MMDVSDGLLLDSERIARASEVTLSLASDAIPFAAGISYGRRGDALRWGDDYQLLFTLPPDATPPCPAFKIGTALPFAGTPLLLDGLRPEGNLGYIHRN